MQHIKKVLATFIFALFLLFLGVQTISAYQATITNIVTVEKEMTTSDGKVIAPGSYFTGTLSDLIAGKYRMAINVKNPGDQGFRYSYGNINIPTNISTAKFNFYLPVNGIGKDSQYVSTATLIKEDDSVTTTQKKETCYAGYKFNFTCPEDDSTTQTQITTKRQGLDIVFVMDKSETVANIVTNMKVATLGIVGKLDSSIDRVGLVSFGDWGTRVVDLNNNFSLTTNAIKSWSAGAKTTNIADGIKKATDMFSSLSKDRKKIMIVVSDGIANSSTNGECSDKESYPVTSNKCTQDALNQATTAKSKGISIYTVGYNFAKTNAIKTNAGSFAKSLMTLISSTSNFTESDELKTLFTVFDNIVKRNTVYVKSALPGCADVSIKFNYNLESGVSYSFQPKSSGAYKGYDAKGISWLFGDVGKTPEGSDFVTSVTFQNPDFSTFNFNSFVRDPNKGFGEFIVSYKVRKTGITKILTYSHSDILEHTMKGYQISPVFDATYEPKGCKDAPIREPDAIIEPKIEDNTDTPNPPDIPELPKQHTELELLYINARRGIENTECETAHVRTIISCPDAPDANKKYICEGSISESIDYNSVYVVLNSIRYDKDRLDCQFPTQEKSYIKDYVLNQTNPYIRRIQDGNYTGRGSISCDLKKSGPGTPIMKPGDKIMVEYDIKPMITTKTTDGLVNYGISLSSPNNQHSNFDVVYNQKLDVDQTQCASDCVNYPDGLVKNKFIDGDTAVKMQECTRADTARINKEVWMSDCREAKVRLTITCKNPNGCYKMSVIDEIPIDTGRIKANSCTIDINGSKKVFNCVNSTILKDTNNLLPEVATGLLKYEEKVIIEYKVDIYNGGVKSFTDPTGSSSRTGVFFHTANPFDQRFEINNPSLTFPIDTNECKPKLEVTRNSVVSGCEEIATTITIECKQGKYNFGDCDGLTFREQSTYGGKYNKDKSNLDSQNCSFLGYDEKTISCNIAKGIKLGEKKEIKYYTTIEEGFVGNKDSFSSFYVIRPNNQYEYFKAQDYAKLNVAKCNSELSMINSATSDKCQEILYTSKISCPAGNTKACGPMQYSHSLGYYVNGKAGVRSAGALFVYLQTDKATSGKNNINNAIPSASIYNFTIQPGEEKTISYAIKTQKGGDYSIDAPMLLSNNYSVLAKGQIQEIKLETCPITADPEYSVKRSQSSPACQKIDVKYEISCEDKSGQNRACTKQLILRDSNISWQTCDLSKVPQIDSNIGICKQNSYPNGCAISCYINKLEAGKKIEITFGLNIQENKTGTQQSPEYQKAFYSINGGTFNYFAPETINIEKCLIPEPPKVDDSVKVKFDATITCVPDRGTSISTKDVMIISDDPDNIDIDQRGHFIKDLKRFASNDIISAQNTVYDRMSLLFYKDKNFSLTPFTNNSLTVSNSIIETTNPKSNYRNILGATKKALAYFDGVKRKASATHSNHVVFITAGAINTNESGGQCTTSGCVNEYDELRKIIDSYKNKGINFYFIAYGHNDSTMGSIIGNSYWIPQISLNKTDNQEYYIRNALLRNLDMVASSIYKEFGGINTNASKCSKGLIDFTFKNTVKNVKAPIYSDNPAPQQNGNVLNWNYENGIQLFSRMPINFIIETDKYVTNWNNYISVAELTNGVGEKIDILKLLTNLRPELIK